MCTFVRHGGGGLQVWDEESGQLHRELAGFKHSDLMGLASLITATADGRQTRIVAGSGGGGIRIYDPEAGALLLQFQGSCLPVHAVACVEESSAAPHHPLVASVSEAVRVWDGETGERLAVLGGHGGAVTAVAVWKEHTGGHDRIATACHDGEVRVHDGEAFTLLHRLDCGAAIERLLAFASVEGPYRLLVSCEQEGGWQVWDPEEGRLLHDGINRGCPLDDCHLLESEGEHYGSSRRVEGSESSGLALRTGLSSPVTCLTPS
jgi:WD40 repeat protein